MIVELTFLTGRFHATPWGRHVNEAVPEWPPSPFRLLRALVDAWYRKHSELPASVVERLLGCLAEPPVFLLPRARASHTRSYLSQNKEDPSDKKLIFDGFAVLEQKSRVLIGWPNLSLDEETKQAAQTLFRSLNYFGRSETWVEAHLGDEREIDWNCVPLAPGLVPVEKEVISVAGVVTPVEFARRGFEVPARSKTKARKPGWLEALTWGSAETIEHTMNRPPALEPIFYLRDKDALNARPLPNYRAPQRMVEAVRFATESRVRVPITDAIRIGEHVRRNLMGGLKKVLGHSVLSPAFTGKDENGERLRHHSHISILSLDEDGDGFIDALLVTNPSSFSIPEQRAIDGLYPVERRNGHPLVLTPIRYGTQKDLLRATTVVVSQTPFAPAQHWRLKRDGDLDTWLARQVSLECERRGLPLPINVQRAQPQAATHRQARWLDFKRARRNDDPQPAYGLRVTFGESVLAPFSLGYASHYGLGCFVAEQVPDRRDQRSEG